jgi:hypothetical protein
MISVGVLDIDKQPEVRDFLWEGISKLPEHSEEAIHRQSFLLKPKGVECDYHFGDMRFEFPLTHLFWHTKTLKAIGGDFKDELFIQKVLKELNLEPDSKVFFYSGDIEEFKAHLSWIEKKTIASNLPPFSSMQCIDVFDLLYPKGFDNLELWLEQTLRT